jgi:hypothetical protein
MERFIGVFTDAQFVLSQRLKKMRTARVAQE